MGYNMIIALGPEVGGTDITNGFDVGCYVVVVNRTGLIKRPEAWLVVCLINNLCVLFF